jgi:DNA-binding NarL/FixJ family response regulator
MKMTQPNNQDNIRILIADDHGIMRRGLELIISGCSGIDIVAQAKTGLKAIELTRKVHPDIVLMDVSMPELNGIDATKEIKIENPKVKVIALSAHANKRFVKDMLAAGASGYILKDSLANELIIAIETVRSGKVYLSPAIAEIVVDDYVTPLEDQKKNSPLDVLTTKERQVLQLIAEDKTTIQTAKLLHLSPKTIEARRLAMMKKLGVNSVVSLTKIAIREGLTTLEF